LNTSSWIFLAIWTSSIEKSLFSSFAHFFIGSLNFGEFSFLSFLYVLVINPLSDVQLAKIFSHSVGNLFNLETISFVLQKLLISCSTICQFFILIIEPFEFYLESHCIFLLIPVYFLSSFKVSGCVLRYLTHFVLIIV
jgi:hypothetical protein